MIDRRQYKAHRLVWLYVTGEWPAADLDHINLKKLDNRLCNLRAATDSAPGKPMEGGFVYAIRGDHNLMKIGVSSNPNVRLASLRTASPFPLELYFVGACETPGYEIEAEAHRLLEAHRTNGEWFDCTPELAGSAILGAAAKLGQKITSYFSCLGIPHNQCWSRLSPRAPPPLSRLLRLRV